MSLENIWLASASPRRRQILSWTGIHFQSISMDIDETVNGNENGEDYVRRLAIEKAKKAADTISLEGLVIAADTSDHCTGDFKNRWWFIPN